MSNRYLTFLRTRIGEQDAIPVRLLTDVEHPPDSGTIHKAGEVLAVAGPALAHWIQTGRGVYEIIDNDLRNGLTEVMKNPEGN
jgi:hypothetical protein